MSDKKLVEGDEDLELNEMNVECNTCLKILRYNDIEGGLVDMDNESDDDESVVEDDITCKHDLVDGKVVVCCKFVVNSDEILEIIHKCSFECTYETDSKLKELEETLMYYICEKNEHGSSIVESVKSTISAHHEKLLDELHDIMYNEFVSSVQNQYHCDYYEKPAVNTHDECRIASKVSPPPKTYINTSDNQTNMDTEDDIKYATLKANANVTDIIWRAFDIMEDRLMYLLSRINVKCVQKFRSIITYIFRKVLIYISNTLIVDLTMDCIFEYRMNVK